MKKTITYIIGILSLVYLLMFVGVFSLPLNLVNMSKLENIESKISQETGTLESLQDELKLKSEELLNKENELSRYKTSESTFTYDELNQLGWVNSYSDKLLSLDSSQVYLEIQYNNIKETEVLNSKGFLKKDEVPLYIEGSKESIESYLEELDKLRFIDVSELKMDRFDITEQFISKSRDEIFSKYEETDLTEEVINSRVNDELLLLLEEKKNTYISRVVVSNYYLYRENAKEE